MGKYNYVSEEKIINMIREKALELVDKVTSKDSEDSFNYIGGAARMANIIIAELQKDDSDDGE